MSFQYRDYHTVLNIFNVNILIIVECIDSKATILNIDKIPHNSIRFFPYCIFPPTCLQNTTECFIFDIFANCHIFQYCIYLAFILNISLLRYFK